MISRKLSTLTVLTLCSALTIGLPTSQAQADQVFLENGDRLTGHILNQRNPQFLQFQTEFGAEINVPWSSVKQLKNEQGETFAMAGSSDIAILIRDDDAKPAEEITVSEEMSEAEKDPSAYTSSGLINLGATLDDGNSSKKSVAGDAKITIRNDINRFITGGEVNYAQDEGEETENDQYVYGEYNRFMNEKWFLGTRQSFRIDKMQELDVRSRTGAFSGYQFYDEDDLKLSIRTGAEYIYEEFSTGDNEEDVALTWAFDYEQQLIKEILRGFHNHDLSAPIDPIDGFLFESETGMRVPIGEYLTGTAQVDFDWDNEPAEGVREEDVTYKFKIGYEW